MGEPLVNCGSSVTGLPSDGGSGPSCYECHDNANHSTVRSRPCASSTPALRNIDELPVS